MLGPQLAQRGSRCGVAVSELCDLALGLVQVALKLGSEVDGAPFEVTQEEFVPKGLLNAYRESQRGPVEYTEVK